MAVFANPVGRLLWTEIERELSAPPPRVFPAERAMRSWGENLHNYEPEFWEFGYQCRRYLKNAPAEYVQRRLDRVRRTRIVLGGGTRDRIPILSFLSSWYWCQKEFETRLELSWRELHRPDDDGLPALRRLVSTPRPFSTRSPNSCDLLVRYGQRVHLETMMRGEVRLSAASSFRSHEGDAARLDDELKKTTKVLGDETTLTLVRTGERIPVRGDIEHTVSHTSDYHALCLSTDLDLSLFAEFGADACLVIWDPEELARRLQRALERGGKGLFHHNPIGYFDPYDVRRDEWIGYVFERKWPSGRRNYCAQWFDQTQGGKRVTRHFDTEKEANDFLDELERQVLAKVYVTPPTVAETLKLDPVELPPAVPTFVEYAQGLLTNRLAATLAKNTVDVYRANLRALSAFYGPREGRAGALLDEVTAATFLDYRAWRRAASNHPSGKHAAVSAATVNRDQQFACRVLNEAVVDRHIAANPLAGLKKLKEPRKPRRYLTREEIAAVIEQAPLWFRPLVVAGVYTGARKCELTRLRWSDIDFDGGKIALFRPKVGNADSIDLHPDVAEELKALRTRREKRKEVKDTDHVFLSRRGGPFTNVSRSWEITLERAGLAGREGLTFHSLRHTHATHFLEGGGAITDLQAQLGHAAVSTTQLYAAAINERRRATVLAMSFRTAGNARKSKRSA